jgi:hypothetical protein
VISVVLSGIYSNSAFFISIFFSSKNFSILEKFSTLVIIFISFSSKEISSASVSKTSSSILS